MSSIIINSKKFLTQKFVMQKFLQNFEIRKLLNVGMYLKLCMVCQKKEDASLLSCHTDILVAWIPMDYFNKLKCIETKCLNIPIHLTYGTTVHGKNLVAMCIFTYIHVHIHSYCNIDTYTHMHK